MRIKKCNHPKITQMGNNYRTLVLWTTKHLIESLEFDLLRQILEAMI